MRLIVDTNVIISALIKDSMTRYIITHINAELITIGFSEKEFSKYKAAIQKKAMINEVEFEAILDKLKEKLVILDDFTIQKNMEEARRIMDSIDPNDTPFIAAALSTNSDIWSDDKHFERQNKVKVWKTKSLEKECE